MFGRVVLATLRTVVVFAGVLLLVHAAVNFFVWPPLLFRRIVRDPRARDDRGQATGYLRGHLVLILLSAVLGIFSVVVGLILILTPLAQAG